MPKVHFLNEVITIVDVPKGTTIYDLAQKHEIQLFKGFFQSYHCSGKGRCMGSGCKVWVNELEKGAVPFQQRKWYVPFSGKLEGTQRMACQATINGDCEVRTQPGAFEPAPNMTWEPDTRKWAWHDRLVQEKKKKKKPAPKPKPAAEAAPAPAAEAAPAPAAEAAPAPAAEAAPKPAAEAAPAPAAEADPVPEQPEPKRDDQTQPGIPPGPEPAPGAEAAGKPRRSTPSETDSGWD